MNGVAFYSNLLVNGTNPNRILQAFLGSSAQQQFLFNQLSGTVTTTGVRPPPAVRHDPRHGHRCTGTGRRPRPLAARPRRYTTGDATGRVDDRRYGTDRREVGDSRSRCTGSSRRPGSVSPRLDSRSVPARRKKPERSSPSTRTISYGGMPSCASGRAASGESSSTALTISGRPGSRQFGQTASDIATLVRGRKISARQPQRGQSTATTRSRSRARVSGPSSVSRAASNSRRGGRGVAERDRRGRDRSRGSGSRRGTGAGSCRTGSSRR